MKDKEEKYLIGILVILIIGILLLINSMQSVEDFFLKNNEEVTEILHQEEFEKDRYLLFYFVWHKLCTSLILIYIPSLFFQLADYNSIIVKRNFTSIAISKDFFKSYI
mgnify:CR=1 FL=1